MCFVIHEKHPDKKIAKRDITCYKDVLSHRNKQFVKSAVKEFAYRFNRLYRTRLDRERIKVFGELAPLNKGFHSTSNKKRNGLWWASDFSVRCIIPKGSEYYYNPEEMEYISNQIIIKEII